MIPYKKGKCERKNGKKTCKKGKLKPKANGTLCSLGACTNGACLASGTPGTTTTTTTPTPVPGFTCTSETECPERFQACFGNACGPCNASGDCDAAGTYDVCLANPPYYSQNRISEIFLQIALKALIPGAWLYLVSKRPDWFFVRLPHLFVNITDIQHRGYTLFSAQKR